MRLPPSVISLIDSHLRPTDLKATKTAFKALGPAPTVANARTKATPSRPQSVSATTTYPTNGQRLSLHRTLIKYPHKPQISLGVAHRLLNDHADAPSPSSRTLQLLSRQTIYERILRTFASSKTATSSHLTIPSIYQRMLEEEVPPNTNILKIILGTALKDGLPILPILRQVVEGSGLPEKLDTHLLVLVAKGLVREVGISSKELEILLDECLKAAGIGKEERPVVFDQLMVEAYGRSGNLKGIISTLDTYKARQMNLKHRVNGVVENNNDKLKNPESTLSLYLEAMAQWAANSPLRRKRHGSLFPRALARDLIAVYGTPHDIPLPFLNAWMNAERIAGNFEAGVAVWELISSKGADTFAYSTYLRLLKAVPAGVQTTELRQTVKAMLESPTVRITPEVMEHAISTAFRYRDLPLALLLARKIDPSSTGHHRGKVPPSNRIIDTLASGLIRVWRIGGLEATFGTVDDKRVHGTKGEQIRKSEWEMMTLAVRAESEGQLNQVTLPMSSPQASLVDAVAGEEGEIIRRYQPGQYGKLRPRLVTPLIGLLEKAVEELHGGCGEGLREIMKKVNDEVLP